MKKNVEIFITLSTFRSLRAFAKQKEKVTKRFDINIKGNQLKLTALQKKNGENTWLVAFIPSKPKLVTLHHRVVRTFSF